MIDDAIQICLDNGYQILKDEATDYFHWSAMFWVEDGPAVYETEEHAADACILANQLEETK